MSANPHVVALIVKSLDHSKDVDTDGSEQRARLSDDGFRAGKQRHIQSWHWCIENGLIEFNSDLVIYVLTPLGETYLDWFVQREAKA